MAEELVKAEVEDRLNVEGRTGRLKVDDRDENGSTALHRAVAGEDAERVKLLLALGASVNACNR